MATIYAPFTPEQVESLKGYQKDGANPFRCCATPMRANVGGLVCLKCGRVQQWAYQFQADGSWKHDKPADLFAGQPEPPESGAYGERR